MNYTVKEAKKELKKGITAYIQKEENGTYCLPSLNRIPFYLEGKPGIGKTEIVRQVAEDLKIGFVSFSITHHTRNSLLGLPVITELGKGKYTEYTMSEIIACVKEKELQGQTEGILLLDEFNCASETIMPTMLAFLQTRNIGKYTLPEGWTIVLCGNPTDYNKSAKRFDAVILDRVRKLQVEYDMKDFLEYAVQKQFHPSIIEYLKVNKAYFYRCIRQKNKEEIVTCRGWENLSHTLKMYEKLDLEIDEKLISQYIKSQEVASSFSFYYWMFTGNITTKELREIMENKNIKKYVQMVQSKNFMFRWKMVEHLFSLLSEDIIEQIKKRNGFLPEERDCALFSKKIHNIFVFLESLSEANALVEYFFKSINENDECIHILANTRNEKYLELCRRNFAEIQV